MTVSNTLGLNLVLVILVEMKLQVYYSKVVNFV